MIFIDLFGHPPPGELIKKGEDLTKQLMSLAPDDRKEFIEHNKKYWGDLKKFYSDLSHGKCWYTEAHDIASHYHMDHYRPKNKTKALKRECDIPTTNNDEAYWWLAFNWKNYRLCASIPNTSKGSYFPLKLGSTVAKAEEDIDQEWPGLIDPTDENDVVLIAFNEAGEVCPACDDDTIWDAIRVKLSVRVYDLNNISLIDARKEIQRKCETKIRQLLAVRNAYPDTNCDEFRKVFIRYVNELRAMTKPDAELSAVARNYIRNYPEEFIRNIAS